MILCLNSQHNRFCDASKRVRPLIGARDLRRIYTYNNMVKCQPPITIEDGRPYYFTATLAYKALHTGQPPYMSELLQQYEPTQTLRSSSSFQLSVPRYNLEFGSRAFRISATKIWNLLPASIRNSPSIPTFRWHLKTHYFQSAYPKP